MSTEHLLLLGWALIVAPVILVAWLDHAPAPEVLPVDSTRPPLG